MNNLPKCDSDIYNNGVEVFLTNTIKAEDVETWVKKISTDSGEKVDWHYAGGRAIILTTGNLEKVREAILCNKSMHDAAYHKAISKFDIFTFDHAEQLIAGVWQYNGF